MAPNLIAMASNSNLLGMAPDLLVRLFLEVWGPRPLVTFGLQM